MPRYQIYSFLLWKEVAKLYSRSASNSTNRRAGPLVTTFSSRQEIVTAQRAQVSGDLGSSIWPIFGWSIPIQVQVGLVEVATGHSVHAHGELWSNHSRICGIEKAPLSSHRPRKPTSQSESSLEIETLVFFLFRPAGSAVCFLHHTYKLILIELLVVAEAKHRTTI